MSENVTGSLESEVLGQGVFVSEFTHSLDPKKRLTIPSEWRAQVGTPRSLYVLPDVEERCLCVLPNREMIRRVNESIRSQAVSDRRARKFMRSLAARADLVAWDVQGRIRIKDELLKFAGLKDHVVMVGAFQHFELWNPDAYAAAGRNADDEVAEAARYVGF